MDDDSVPARAGDEAHREWLALLDGQDGVVDRGQAIRLGFSDRQITHRLNSGRWQRLQVGVYATFSGPASRNAQLWAATRWAGEGAMLSHETAAELHGIIDSPSGSAIHVTVPLPRRLAQTKPAPGIVVHRADRSRPPYLGPFTLPRTGIEDTVLDLVAAAPTFDSAYSWIARAVSRRLVTPDSLRTALAGRSRARWRSWLNDAFEESADGVYSALERRYVADVERAHGLPKSQHQVRGEFGQDRDNANLALDDVRTFRFGPVAVTERACETAVMVAATLMRNGWTGSPHPCRRPGCALRNGRGG